MSTLNFLMMHIIVILGFQSHGLSFSMHSNMGVYAGFYPCWICYFFRRAQWACPAPPHPSLSIFSHAYLKYTKKKVHCVPLILHPKCTWKCDNMVYIYIFCLPKIFQHCAPHHPLFLSYDKTLDRSLCAVLNMCSSNNDRLMSYSFTGTVRVKSFRWSNTEGT